MLQGKFGGDALDGRGRTHRKLLGLSRHVRLCLCCVSMPHTRIQNVLSTHLKPTAESTGLDPIFFMHHSNIDFIFALYQAFKPDVALTEGQFMDGTFLVPPSMDDNYVGSFSDMSPFYKNPSRRKNYYKVFSPFRLHSSLFDPYPSHAAATSHPFYPSIPPFLCRASCHSLVVVPV